MDNRDTLQSVSSTTWLHNFDETMKTGETWPSVNGERQGECGCAKTNLH